jgi:pilus assembly protein CpaF
MNFTPEQTRLNGTRSVDAFDESNHDQRFRVDASVLEIVDTTHRRLLQEVDLAALSALEGDAARRAVENVARRLVGATGLQLSAPEREDVVMRVIDEVLGLGPIEQLLHDETISEVMVNDFDEVYYERDGVIYDYPIGFRDRDHVLRIIDRITSAVGRRVDEASPMVDARLADGSRVNAAIPPVVPRGPVLTIRKFRRDKHTLAQLIENATLPVSVAEFLGLCVRHRLNVIVSGGTGSGKTTFLNALSEHIPPGERIVTIEDPTELRLQQRHVIAMEARPPNIEGKNPVTQRDLFRNSLRMRPDRIIVGEVRGSEAFDMMQAMNTGHDGSLTTIHANSPRDALSRIENMVLMAGYELPVRAIREQVASAIDLIVHLARMSDGSRRVTRVTEITGMESEVVTAQDIFVFRQEGLGPNGEVRGSLGSTGLMPAFADRLRARGEDVTRFVQGPLSGNEVAAWTR